MDVQFFPKRALIREGDNEVIILASSHQGYTDLYAPVHIIALKATGGGYANLLLSRYIPTLITLGLFIVGILYYSVSALIPSFVTYKKSHWILAVTCFFAAAQLLAETARGFYTYTYPVHDLRLIAIMIFSIAYGFSVMLYVFRMFTGLKTTILIVGIVAVLEVIILLAIPSFDFKALVGMTLPLIAALAATALWSYQRRERAFLHFLSLLIFVASLVALQGLFLDTIFFFLVAFFLIILFVEQAVSYAKETRQRQNEENRANRLAMALAEIEERHEASIIKVRSSGKMEQITSDQIIHCRSLDGYSELVLHGGNRILHSVSLNELASELPATFLRVHRSHIINVSYIKSLSRDPSGTGKLNMEDNIIVPVSRRILPKIRKVIA